LAHAQTTTPKWALILGASSGFGEGAARALAKAGYDIAGVHLDRKAGMDHVAELRRDLEAMGRKTQYFNVNAADEEKRNEVLAELAKQKLNVAVLLHSLAFGTLKPYIGDDVLNKANIDMTLDVMAHSLVYWAQGVVKRGLMGKGGRIFSMTSSGSTRVFATYGAVSAAKAAGVRAIVQVEHDMDLVERYSHRIVALQEGTVLADMAPDAFFADPAMIAAVVGTRPQIHRKRP